MSHLLELLGRGLDADIGDVLDRYYWSPPTRSLDELEKAVSIEPHDAAHRMRLGLVLLRCNRTEDAIANLTAARAADPDALAIRLALAAALNENGNIAKALDELKMANQIVPAQGPILFAIGFCFEKLSDPAKAKEYYLDAVDRDPMLDGARERLAAVAVLLGDVELAVQQYEAIGQAHPEMTWVPAALGHLHCQQRNYDGAVEQFERAIALEPENWSLRDDEVEALVAEGNIREAIERLQWLIEQQGDFADLHCRLADLYSHNGDDGSARTHYLRALDVEPEYLDGMVKLGLHHLSCGRWEAAAEMFQVAADRNDQNLTHYVGLGVAQAHTGRHQDAMNSFELAAAMEPNSTTLMSEVAKLQLKAAVADGVINAFEAGEQVAPAEIELDNDDLLHQQIERHDGQVRRNPDRADVRYRYGVLLRSQGRLGEAKEQFAAAVQINPTYVQAIIKLGITQQELGFVKEAAETFKKALTLRPEYVDVHYRLGLLYTDRREFERAVEHMTSAADGAPDNDKIRAGLALALQNMGLMDRAASTWRSLWKLHKATA